eukprot:TRINITY_DN21485_c1_g2_i1.p1 TRINITY_DN21485_c1_g2~~TRINITY_DN21485_c1_g2_i1.p1  ORF type:complete len:387 (+),score=62.43 TRINITY_DN21485_c1_g2_i1:96-1256(+)
MRFALGTYVLGILRLTSVLIPGDALRPEVAQAETTAPPFADPPSGMPQSTCGEVITDCDKVDYGSCGNNCCALDATFKEAPKQIYFALANFLQTGDPSNVYEFESSNVSENANWQYSVTGRHYADLDDFMKYDQLSVIISNDGRLRAYSASNSLRSSDKGQNYKNLKFLLNEVDVKDVTIVHGCGKKADIPMILRPGETPYKQSYNFQEGSICKPGVIDCDMVDGGSCGTPCCSVTAALDQDFSVLVDAAMRAMDPGVDGHFVTMSSKERGQVFTLLGAHTLSEEGLDDQIAMDFRTMKAGNLSLVVLRMSSVSPPGKLHDDGQNYKNLVYVAESMGIDEQYLQVEFGCGKHERKAITESGTPSLWPQVICQLLAVVALWHNSLRA